MAYFKDGNDGYYVIESNSDSNLIEITREEYTIANRPLPPTVAELRAAKQAQIDAIEAKAFMTRRFREKEIEDNLKQVLAAGYTHDFAYANNLYYKATWDENEAAKLLRAELKAIV